MAYAALISLAQLLHQILQLRHQFFYVPHSDDEQRKLESLLEKVCFLQGFLDDNCSQKAGVAIQSDVEAKIRDAAYQAQDIVEVHISDEKVQRGFRKLVSGIRKVRRPTIQMKYEEDLQMALEMMDSIVAEVMTTQISCRDEKALIYDASAQASIQVSNCENKIVGFDEDVLEIKERLCGESSKLEVIPIVGMGGIGKTTLARYVFDDSLVTYHFHCRVWIPLSQQYNLRGVLLGLINHSNEITKKSSETNTTEIEDLMLHVYKNLKGIRYLIVMDDMWSVEAWDDLRRIFPDDNNGSRVVITTRLTDVAEYVSSNLIHRMHFLNEDQSWNMLQEKVFGEQSCPGELEKIGRVIAKNCGGLPLAIAVVAGILTKSDQTVYYWENIAKDIRLAMAATDENFYKILSLSYDHLPNHLKACFLYMGLFPEDHEIRVSKLIMLWVAEGFLKPIGSEVLEEVGEEYLGNLVKRNLVLITKNRSNGRFRTCRLHDLVRDLCIRKAQEEKFLDVYNSGIHTGNQRRLTIPPHLYFAHGITSACTWPIRSILHFGNYWELPSSVLPLRLLRVLDISQLSLYLFPSEITELLHLRYLAFAWEKQKPLLLPPSISKLCNLQTLIIQSRVYFTSRLPLKIMKIPQLKHLILRGSRFEIHLAPNKSGQFPVLENLHTLSGVINFKFTSKALNMIQNLKKLKLCCTYTKYAKLCLNNLFRLEQLETLNLDFIDDVFPPNISYTAYSYALPPSLKKLALKGLRPPSRDMSIIGSLPNLEVLKLKVFEFVQGDWVTREGEFPRLKFLLMEESNLSRWQVESSHLPCLQQLVIRYCWELAEIPREIGDITTLKLIELDPINKSAVDSAMLIREELESLGNDTLQVRICK